MYTPVRPRDMYTLNPNLQPPGYNHHLQGIIAKDGVSGLMGRGLKTKIFANGLQVCGRVGGGWGRGGRRVGRAEKGRWRGAMVAILGCHPWGDRSMMRGQLGWAVGTGRGVAAALPWSHTLSAARKGSNAMA